LLVAGAIGVTVCAITATTEAQSAREVTPDDAQAAAEAYDRGSSAYLSRNYAQAAQYFEMADRLAPSGAALQQALRAHERAGNTLRAANLALRLRERYPDERQAVRAADRTLGGAESQFYRVEVQCEGCSILLDGAVLDHPVFFVEPGTEHVVVGHFDTGDVEETVRGGAGERRELALEAPEPSEAPTDDPAEPVSTTADPGGPQLPATDDGGGVSPVFTIALGVLTLGAAGAATWSGLDALAGVDGYEADPTIEALEAGQARERRTNILIGVTAGLAAVTIALALFTDYGGEAESEASVRAAIAPLPGGGAVGMLEGATW
jgi:hypothetical protein